MEEQNKNKNVKLGVVKGENKQDNTQPPKYTYDQLNEICGKLFQENQYLKQQLQQAHETISMFNRLNYLLKIVEINARQSNWHFTDDFMANSIKEIEGIMAIPEEAKEEEKED